MTESGRQVPTLRIALRPSRMLIAMLATAHLAAVAAAAVSHPGTLLKLALCAALAVNGCWTLRRHGLLKAAASIVALEIRGESDCLAQMRDQRWIECRVLASSYVTPLLVVLHLRCRGHRFARHVVILPDSMPAETFRRLRVRLRWSNVDA